LPAFGSRSTEQCRARTIAAELNHEGYTADSPRGYTASTVDIGDGATASHMEVPSRYKGRSYTWNLDTTAVEHGRLIALIGTVTAGPFATSNQDTAKELVKAST
jgi:hypothetical protein